MEMKEDGIVKLNVPREVQKLAGNVSAEEMAQVAEDINAATLGKPFGLILAGLLLNLVRIVGLAPKECHDTGADEVLRALMSLMAANLELGVDVSFEEVSESSSRPSNLN